jgi:hypothetical protein
MRSVGLWRVAWGSADAGGAWTVSAPSAFSVGSAVGSLAVPGGSVQRLAHLESVSARDVDLRVDSAFGSLGSGGAHLQHLVGRRQASGAYLRVGVMASGGKLLIRGQSRDGRRDRAAPADHGVDRHDHHRRQP